MNFHLTLLLGRTSVTVPVIFINDFSILKLWPLNTFDSRVKYNPITAIISICGRTFPHSIEILCVCVQSFLSLSFSGTLQCNTWLKVAWIRDMTPWSTGGLQRNFSRHIVSFYLEFISYQTQAYVNYFFIKNYCSFPCIQLQTMNVDCLRKKSYSNGVTLRGQNIS